MSKNDNGLTDGKTLADRIVKWLTVAIVLALFAYCGSGR